MASRNPKSRKQAVPAKISTGIENDASHHLTGPFLPQTPLGSETPERAASPHARPKWQPKQPAPWLVWATNPVAALKVLALPVVLYLNYELVARYVAVPFANPFARLFLLSGHVEASAPDDPRYAKSWFDLAFLAYYIVFFSLVRQSITIYIGTPLARYFGLRKETKIDRFGEQAYALIYFSFFGAWGYRVMKQLPTFWYQTKYFWIDYPHWDMNAELKRYYLMQFAYWCQQLIVLVLGLEKPRKDYGELVAHHIVTLWLVGWSYIVNMTLIGNAVYMSMDIPDAFLAASKLLNYIQWNRAKIVSFVTFIAVWTYFRHYLNIKILWSSLFETKLAPEASKLWSFTDGAYMVSWMPAAIFLSIFALQILNLFWYYLMWRILLRAIVTREADDDRSDDEDEEEEEIEPKAVANGNGSTATSSPSNLRRR